ncbi:MAG: hypothetical protein AB1641_27840 [Thermodesulfobacteriota bacterium]
MRFCDLKCPHASFPKENALDGAGSCRTFVALHCAVLDRLVHKNGPCQAPDLAATKGDGK